MSCILKSKIYLTLRENTFCILKIFSEIPSRQRKICTIKNWINLNIDVMGYTYKNSRYSKLNNWQGYGGILVIAGKLNFLIIKYENIYKLKKINSLKFFMSNSNLNWKKINKTKVLSFSNLRLKNNNLILFFSYALLKKIYIKLKYKTINKSQKTKLAFNINLNWVYILAKELQTGVFAPEFNQLITHSRKKKSYNKSFLLNLTTPKDKIAYVVIKKIIIFYFKYPNKIDGSNNLFFFHPTLLRDNNIILFDLQIAIKNKVINDFFKKLKFLLKKRFKDKFFFDLYGKLIKPSIWGLWTFYSLNARKLILFLFNYLYLYFFYFGLKKLILFHPNKIFTNLWYPLKVITSKYHNQSSYLTYENNQKIMIVAFKKPYLGLNICRYLIKLLHYFTSLNIVLNMHYYQLKKKKKLSFQYEPKKLKLEFSTTRLINFLVSKRLLNKLTKKILTPKWLLHFSIYFILNFYKILYFCILNYTKKFKSSKFCKLIAHVVVKSCSLSIYQKLHV